MQTKEKIEEVKKAIKVLDKLLDKDWAVYFWQPWAENEPSDMLTTKATDEEIEQALE